MIAAPEATASPRQGLWQITAHYAAPALVLLAIVVPFLRFNEYSLLLPESLILLGGAAAIGVAVAALSRLRPQTLGPMLMAATLCVYALYRQEVADALVVVANAAGEVLGYPVVILVLLAVVLFLAVCLICVLLGRHLNTVVAAVFGTMVLSTIALPTETGGEPVMTGSLPNALKPLPPIIQIILDEHIGLAGLPEDLDESFVARRDIPETYKDFALYSHAFSRFAETKFSLTSLMNRDAGADVEAFLDRGPYQSAPTQNAWFDTLRNKGYAIKVYQSAWYDMCGGPPQVDACYTYSFFSPNAIQRSSLSTAQRLRAVTRKLLMGRGALELEPLVGMEALTRFRADIAEAPRGVAFIVHLLIPHSGYLYGDDCSLLDPSRWEREGFGEDLAYSPEQRKGLYRRYLSQLACTNRQMQSLFAELKTLGVYDEATIIVHGDHGSRIGERPYITGAPETLTDQDKIDHYATLLAIKAPGIAPGVRDEPVALQKIFAETFLDGTSKTGPGPGEVFIRTFEDDLATMTFPWPDVPKLMARQSLAHEQKVGP